MKRISNKILAIVLLFALFIGTCPGIVRADEEVEETPRVVFENTQNEEPDLHITKTVVSADERYEAPADDVFDFNLQLDGAPARDREYLVFNANGERVYNYTDGQSTEDKSNKIPFETDRMGNFTLMTGQRAVFRWVGSGVQYVITEYPKAGYIQTQPAGGLPAAGTMDPNGNGEVFINTYLPPGENETTTLRIEKLIVFPNGYELPETPDFTFLLELEGKPYKGEPFTIIGPDGLTAGTGTTDENGKFTLKGGQSAVFADVPVDVDYKVTEEDTLGWRVIGTTTRQGATKAPITWVSFTNANTSFGVTKRMEGNATYEVDFTFVLTDYQRKPLADVEYYLYASDGTRLPGGPYSTDSEGKFTLKPNQTAIFTGLPLETIYNVHEEAGEGFVQVVPASVNGYTNQKVEDTLMMLGFVNRQVDRKGTLNVTKEIVIEGEEGITTDPEFTFQLSKKLDNGTYETIPNAVYSIAVGGFESTYRTNAQGQFKLKRNETATFKDLTPGTTYQVKEVNLPIGYTIDLPENIAKEAELGENSINFTFTNVYDLEEFFVDLIIHKRDEDNTPLAGAIFNLYTTPNHDVSKMVGSKETGADGIISFEGLELGTYWLHEIQSPPGYRLLANPVKIEIYNREGALAVKVNDKIYTSTDSTTGIYMTSNAGGNDGVNIVITNNKGFTMPLTGSGGLTIAIMIVLIGIAFLYRSMFYKKIKFSRQERE